MPERSAPSDWEARPSILAQLRAWSAKHPLRPTDGGPPTLCDPDEIPIVWTEQPPQQVRLWFRKEARDADEDRAVDAVVTAIEQMCVHPDATSQAATTLLYQSALGLERSALGLILAKLRAQRLTKAQVRASARWLLEHAMHGEAIDLGIFLTGTTKDRDALPDVQTLTRHPSFWLLGIWTLDYFQEDTVDLWWGRADRLDCRGRTRVFLRLASRLADRPDVRDWILRHGAGGCDLGETVVACAVAGDLAGALQRPGVDDELLDAACSLIRSLIQGGRTIELYPDGVVALDRLVGHLLDRCVSLRQLDLVREIATWLEWPTEQPTFGPARRLGVPESDVASVAEAVWERLEALGWTDEVRARLTDDCSRIMRRSEWPARVREAFAEYTPPLTSDTLDGWEDLQVAWAVAPFVGVDLWEDGFLLAERHQLDPALYRRLLDTDYPTRLLRVVRLCERTIPPTIRASAPDGLDTVGRTPVLFLFHHVLSVMAKHGIPSEQLVPLALRCRGEARALATCVLDRTPSETWGEEVVAALHRLAGYEPHEDATECRPHLLERLKRLDPDRWSM